MTNTNCTFGAEKAREFLSERSIELSSDDIRPVGNHDGAEGRELKSIVKSKIEVGGFPDHGLKVRYSTRDGREFLYADLYDEDDELVLWCEISLD